MKALMLKLQAFGPFAKIQKIDFSLFGESSLYLINGNTGSGKTTLLDAISFALYGDSTGKERDPADMRCNYADENLLTEVKFDFKLGDKTYRIQRIPRQEVKKSRGEGFTTKSAEANLWAINAEGEETLIIAKKVSEVTKKVTEIMGLNSEQFRQVMVLPQGRFRELLLADSKDREVIFSQLFQTQIYKKVEDSIKEQAKSVKDRIQEYHVKMSGILETVNLSSADEVEDNISILQPEYQTHQSQKTATTSEYKKAIEASQVAEGVAQQFKNLKTQQEKLAQTQLKQPNIDVLKQAMQDATSANKIKSVFDVLQNLQQELTDINLKVESIKSDKETATQELLVAKEKWETATQNAQELEALNRQHDKLKGYTEDNKALVGADSALKLAKSKAKASEKDLEKIQKLVREKHQAQQALEERLQTLQNRVGEEAKYQSEATRLKEHLNALTEQQQQEKLLQIKQNEICQAKEQVEQALLKYKTSQETTLDLEMRWHLGQAAFLASTLKNDQACPVCGSLEHPKLAQWQDPTQAVDKAQIEVAQQKTNVYHQNHAQAENHLVGLQSEFKVMENHLDTLKQTLSQYPQEENLKTVKSRLTEVKQTLQEIKKAIKELTQATFDLQNLKQENQTREQELKEWEARVNEQHTLVQLKLQAWETIQSKLPEAYRNEANLLNEIRNIQNQIENIKQAQDATGKAFNEAKSRADKAQQSYEDSIEQLQEIKNKLIASEQEWQTILQESCFKDENEFKAAQWTSAQFTEAQQDITQFEEEKNQLNGSIQQLTADLAGKTPPDLTEFHNKVAITQNIMKQAEIAFNKIDHKMQLLQSVKEKLKKAEEANQKLLEEYKLIGTLSEVLSGTEGDKVSLQRFVLSLLLDDVLQLASERLKMMSTGRYELVRKMSRSKGNKASGLELEIYDTWNDKSRGVATLSGGESFMAALSLALGLSEVVQSYSGGIKLDTLFIDEGFGSLDQDSLYQSIEMLKQLQENGRSIGIISHVTELKDQMANRIDIVPSITGSYAKVVCPN